jgi:hypothetical protein
MRKFLLGLLVAASVGLTTMAFTSKPVTNDKFECQYGQCAKIKDDGHRCKNCAQQGSIYCWSHNHR